MTQRALPGPIRIGLAVIASSADNPERSDQVISELKEWFERVVANPTDFVERRVPSEQVEIESTLTSLVDEEGCCLILTVGSMGPRPRDVAPDATLSVADKELPGIGERLRSIGRSYAPLVMLSRAVAVVRGQRVILNLSDDPYAMVNALDAVFPVVPYCLDLIGGPYIEPGPGRVEAAQEERRRLSDCSC
jgi:molybdopterin adenylyltransferase